MANALSFPALNPAERDPGQGVMPRRAIARIVEPLESRTFLSTTYFVATNGSDSGPGTLAQPFKTIQQAATIAQSGDAVDIEGGTYRETVHPANPGVTFANYTGQTVTIAGTDPLTGWSPNGESVYKAAMPWDLGEGSNQIFVDGQTVNEARWPNSTPDVSHPVEATVGGYSNGILYDSSITQGNGFWAGATITITPGDGWVAYTGAVTNSGPGWLQVSLPVPGGIEMPVAGNHYFLSGTFQALDAPGEWYRDASGTLYLWDPSGDSPASHDIEVKHRQYGFDLTGVANTTIQGINLFACTIHTDWASSGTVVNGIVAAYVTQFDNLWNSGWAPPGPDGIELNGAGSTIENSTIAFSAGDGAYVGAANVRVTNNVIHDVDYSDTDAAGVRVYGVNAVIDHNTIYNAGRDGINLKAAPAQVTNNVIHDFMLQTYDGAGIYAIQLNGQGSQIAYNTIFNAHDDNYNGLNACGIMLDANSSNFVVHDNVTANVDVGFKANDTSYAEQVYNNLLGATQFAIQTNGWTGFAYDWSGSQLYNNVFYNPNIELGANVAQWNNAYASGSPPINVPPTPASSIPTPEPAVPTSAAPGTDGSAASGEGSSSQLAGTVKGTFRATRKTVRAAATYSLRAAATFAAFGKVSLVGTGIGAVRKSSAGGTIRLANAKGAVTLTLSVPGATVVGATPTNFGYTITRATATVVGATPTNFGYTITRATGAYKKMSGTGTANLTFAPSTKRGLAGTFTLVL